MEQNKNLTEENKGTLGAIIFILRVLMVVLLLITLQTQLGLNILKKQKMAVM